MAGYWPSSLWCLYGPRQNRSEIRKKKERSILTEQAWSVKNLVHGFKGTFSCGTQRVVPCQIGKPITAQDLVHLACSRSLPCNCGYYLARENSCPISDISLERAVGDTCFIMLKSSQFPYFS